MTRLDLSKNELSDIKGVAFNKELSWLSVAGNHLKDLSNFSELSKLKGTQGAVPLHCVLMPCAVLTASNNEIARVEGLHRCTKLNAIVLAHNQIKYIQDLSALKELNTIVLSHNQLELISSIGQPTGLVKLAVAHNKLRMIPDLTFAPKLQELRWNDNKLLNLPETLARCPAYVHVAQLPFAHAYTQALAARRWKQSYPVVRGRCGSERHAALDTADAQGEPHLRPARLQGQGTPFR